MTTVVLLLLATVVVSWVFRRALLTDRSDETDQFHHVQEIVAGWTEEARASQSRNDSANNG
ncbi:MAG TPA: hypothetical protein VEV13_08040 [Candidatus Limnocylindria bacterium]|nr:hypothetical protein [Candidatus Limnocylindria bacterium]